MCARVTYACTITAARYLPHICLSLSANTHEHSNDGSDCTRTHAHTHAEIAAKQHTNSSCLLRVGTEQLQDLLPALNTSTRDLLIHKQPLQTGESA